MERAMRIELTTKAWEAFVLPLNYARKIDCYLIVSRLFEMSNKIVLLKANVFFLLYGFVIANFAMSAFWAAAFALLPFWRF